MVNTTSVAPLSGLGLRFLEWSKTLNVDTADHLVYVPIDGGKGHNTIQDWGCICTLVSSGCVYKGVTDKCKKRPTQQTICNIKTEKRKTIK